MPRFYLTAVAAAVMAATVNAAEFPAIPTDQTDYNEIIYRDDANDRQAMNSLPGMVSALSLLANR